MAWTYAALVACQLIAGVAEVASNSVLDHPYPLVVGEAGLDQELPVLEVEAACLGSLAEIVGIVEVA